MKGTLNKHEEGWLVRYGDMQFLPLHPDFIEMMDTCFTSNFTQVVDFEMVLCSNSKSKDDYYAKLINHSVESNEMIDHNGDVNDMVFTKDINGVIVKVGDKVQGIGSLKFQDGFEIDRTPVVTANIQNGKLYFGNLSAESFTLGFKIVESKMVEDDVEKLAEAEYPIFDGDLLGIANNQQHSRVDFIKGYNKAKETLYTEKDMLGFAEWIINQDMKMVLINTKKSLLNEYVQSLKQPKL
jgi:hypothetical protein